MKPFMTRKTTKTSLLAAGLLICGLAAHAHAVDTTKTAIRPEALGTADFYPTGYGTQPIYGAQQPYNGYSQPVTYPSGASCPNGQCTNGYCPTGNCPTGNCPNGQCTSGYCPNGNCPTGNCPNGACPTGACPNGQCPNTNSYPYGANDFNSTASPYDPNSNYLPPNYQSNYGPSFNTQGPAQYDRFRNQSVRPGSSFPDNWTPSTNYQGGFYPNSNYPNSTYPNTNAYPTNIPLNLQPVNNYPAFPSNGYPSSNYPANGGYVTPTNYQQPNWPTVPTAPVYQPIPRQVNQADDIDAKITARYQNSEMLAFLNRTNVNQAMNLYTEASRLIDTRHVSPASYEVRTQRALTNLDHAIHNPAFLQASGVNPDPARVAALSQQLEQMAQSSPARTANEAIGLMQWAADLANQQLGVRREAVALEFVNGSIDSLDKYSAFVPSKQAYGFNEDGMEYKSALLEENIVGVGIEMKAHEQGALVMGTVDNGPAARARIQKGDLLTGVDGRSLAGMSLSQIADLVAGPAGSTVTFRINRSGQDFTVSLRRENVYVSSVASVQMLDQTTGYMRLKQFSESSAEDLEKNMWNLYKSGMKSLVLDLRGNPGGLLTEAVQVSNLFVPSGRIVATKGRTAADDSDEQATWDKTWRLPLVVLVDENSASASEIFAAAIQENGRGVIVGRTTYGKGTVQTHFPLQSVTGNLKLTTAKFYSPQGREMAGAGVRPDVAVNGSTDDFLTAAITSDQDVRTALQVMAQGTPASLAANSQQSRPSYDLSQLGH